MTRSPQLCDEVGCRYVRMGSAQLDDADHMVASNDREAVREATDYLIQQGHRLIGLIEGPDGFRSARERRLRLRGCAEGGRPVSCRAA